MKIFDKFKKHKKLGIWSTSLMLIIGTIGSGIFFKNSEILLDGSNSILILILSWLISSVGMILLGVSISIITKSIKSDDTSFLSWIKKYNSARTYNASTNFVLFYYLPFVRIGVIYYAVIALQNALNWMTASWWQIGLIVFLIFILTSLSGGINIKSTNIMNHLFTIIKLIPIIFIVGFGIYASLNNKVNTLHWLPTEIDPNLRINRPFQTLTPWMGIISSIPSIYYVYDGFYKVASVKSDMKDPKKLSLVIVFGMITLIVINIVLSLFLILGFGGDFTNSTNAVVVKVVNWMIIGSTLGAFNMNAIMTSKFYEHFWIIKRYKCFNWINLRNSSMQTPYNGNCISFIIGSIIILLTTIIGGLWFFNSLNMGYLNDSANTLYSFNGVLINWASTFIFLIILLPLIGYLKTNKLASFKQRMIITATLIIFIIPSLYIVIEVFGNFIMMISSQYWLKNKQYQIAWQATIIKLVWLIATCSFYAISYSLKPKFKNLQTQF